MKRYLLTVLTAKPELMGELLDIVKAHSASIEKSEDLGSRKLAYKVNKKDELNLVSIFFKLEPSAVKALEEQLKANEDVERFLLTTWLADPNKERTKKPAAARANV